MLISPSVSRAMQLKQQQQQTSKQKITAKTAHLKALCFKNLRRHLACMTKQGKGR